MAKRVGAAVNLSGDVIRRDAGYAEICGNCSLAWTMLAKLQEKATGAVALASHPRVDRRAMRPDSRFEKSAPRGSSAPDTLRERFEVSPHEAAAALVQCCSRLANTLTSFGSRGSLGSVARHGLLAAALCVGSWLASTSASAQTSTTTTGTTTTTATATPTTSSKGTISLDQAHITRAGGYRTNASRKMWISYKDCVGDPTKKEIADGDVFHFPVSMTDYSHPLEVWAGNDDCVGRRGLEDHGQCWEVGSLDRPQRTNDITVPVRNVVAQQINSSIVPTSELESVCEINTDPNGVAVTFFFMTVSGGQVYDSVTWNASTYGGTGWDLVGPLAPTSLSVGVGERQLTLNIGGVVLDTDRDHYQMFCVPAGTKDAGPGGVQPRPEATGDTTDLVANDAGVLVAQTTPGDAGVPLPCATPLMVTGYRPPLNFSCGTATETSTSFNTDRLQNGMPYAVGVSAVDIVGNAGPLSPIQCGTPIPLDDFFEVYTKNGGKGGGGFCSAAPGVAQFSAARWLLLAFAGLGWAARRSRRTARVSAGRGLPGPLALCLLFPGLLFAPAATAQSMDTPAPPGEDDSAATPDGPHTLSRPPLEESVPVRERRNDYSPQNLAVEVRFGPYSPKINPGFTEFFGKKQRYQFGVEIDWQMGRIPHLGTLGLGGSLSYTQMSGANQLPPSEAGLAPAGPIGQETSLKILPMYAVGVLRIDAAARELHIPLVPYAKLGLGYALWWCNNGIATCRGYNPAEDGDTNPNAVDQENKIGRGASIGTQAALGMMFLLDILEPSAGLALDNETGINNSYLFLEWSMSNFAGDQMNVGTNTWVAGLAFEM
jgi:hypothetical protein